MNKQETLVLALLNFWITTTEIRKNLNRHQDDGHDGELPLQGHHVCSHGFSFVNSDTFELAVIEPLEDQSISVFYQPPFSSAALGGIFQPPQV
jgi:hypothetical protein